MTIKLAACRTRVVAVATAAAERRTERRTEMEWRLRKQLEGVRYARRRNVFSVFLQDSTPLPTITRRRRRVRRVLIRR